MKQVTLSTFQRGSIGTRGFTFMIGLLVTLLNWFQRGSIGTRGFTLLIGLLVTSLNASSQALFPLGATAFDKKNASIGVEVEDMVPLETQVQFEGGISVNGSDFLKNGIPIQNGPVKAVAYGVMPSDTLEIRFRIKPEPAHVGQVVDISVSAGYFNFKSVLGAALQGLAAIKKLPLFFTLDSQNNMLVLPERWGGDQLVPLKTMTLQPTQEIVVYKGRMGEGSYWINCYYRLADGTVVFNKDIIALVSMPNLFDLLR